MIHINLFFYLLHLIIHLCPNRVNYNRNIYLNYLEIDLLIFNFCGFYNYKWAEADSNYRSFQVVDPLL